jgi:hypothetical protein
MHLPPWGLPGIPRRQEPDERSPLAGQVTASTVARPNKEQARLPLAPLLGQRSRRGSVAHGVVASLELVGLAALDDAGHECAEPLVELALDALSELAGVFALVRRHGASSGRVGMGGRLLCSPTMPDSCRP